MGYVKEQRRKGLAGTTIRRRVTTLRHFDRWLGPVSLLDATDLLIESWLDACDLGPGSRFLYLSTLSSFYAFLRRHGMVQVNPAEDIPRPKLPHRMPRPIATDDLSYALDAADVRMQCWLLLGAYQGFRCVEIAGLRREDILEQEDPPLLLVSNAKGGHQRMLPLNSSVEKTLRDFGLPARGFVFTHDDGRAFRADTLSVYISRFLRDIGVEASAHQLRHWFGTTVYAKTLDIRLTQEMMGHRSPATTAVYAAFSPHRAAAVIRDLAI